MLIDYPEDLFTYPDVPLPEVWAVLQPPPTPALATEEVALQVSQAVAELVQKRGLAPGSSVCVGVGSRGLDNLVLVVRSTVSELKRLGMCPFIIPAMGSHGGATDEGQIEILRDYGISAESTGAEIRSSMAVDQIGVLSQEEGGPYAGQPVFCDRHALSADAILLINRIKPHTDFSGEMESGIGKMSVIGLGKRHGAESVHRHGATGLRDMLPLMARFQASNLKLLGGIALLENEECRTCEVHPLPAEGIAQEPEKALLRRARNLCPSLPFDEIDVLVIDEMGKNISGACMDTHVIGRGVMPSIPENQWGGPNIRVIAVLDLTEESHGNVAALGLADITTKRLIDKADFIPSFINMRTSGEGGILRAKLPLILSTSEDCVKTAYATCGRGNHHDVRFARIRNTLHTRTIEISEALLDDAKAHGRLTIDDAPHPLDLSNKLPRL